MPSSLAGTPTFAQLATFSLGRPTTPSPTSATFPHDEELPLPNEGEDVDEPDLDGLRHLSVSTDASTESRDEAVTPPQSPSIEEPVIYMSTKRTRGSDFDDTSFLPLKAGRVDVTPPSKAVTPTVAVTPTATMDLQRSLYFVTPPTPPRLRLMKTSSTESLRPGGGVAARRAASGKLPSKALLSLQKMRFEAQDAGMGLGVGPSSPSVFDEMEDLSPGLGMTLRFALGLDGEDSLSNVSTPTGMSLGSPSLLRTSSTSCISRRPPRSPGIEGTPQLRSSSPSSMSRFERLNSPGLSSPMLARQAPSSPLIMRSSAYTAFSNQGPLTPLTPSHLPGAPKLDASQFDYFFPSSPVTPSYMYAQLEPSVTRTVFLDTPPSDGVLSPRPMLFRSHSHMGSPLRTRDYNVSLSSSVA